MTYLAAMLVTAPAMVLRGCAECVLEGFDICLPGFMCPFARLSVPLEAFLGFFARPFAWAMWERGGRCSRASLVLCSERQGWLASI